jgi:hypothetical protein
LVVRAQLRLDRGRRVDTEEDRDIASKVHSGVCRRSYAEFRVQRLGCTNEASRDFGDGDRVGCGQGEASGGLLAKRTSSARDVMRKVLLVLVVVVEEWVAEVVHGYDHQQMCYRDSMGRMSVNAYASVRR